METSRPTAREAWLDSLKGFAALLVVLGHVLSGYLDAGTFPAAYDSFYAVRTWIYSFHMPLFFLLSGFTFTLAYYRGGTLRRGGYLRQLANLLWIYVVFALLQWCVKQAVPDLVNEAYTLEDLKRMFLVPLGNFWYIYVLIALYLLGALLRLPVRRPVWLVPLCGVSVYVAYVHLDWTQLTIYRILYHLFFFAAGSMLCVRRRYLSSEKFLGISLMLLATAAYFYFFWHIRSWYASWKVLIAAGTSFFYVYAFHHWQLLTRFPLFRVCGKYALELYLLHTFFTGGLRTLLSLAGMTGPWLSVWVNFVVSTAVSLLLAYLAGRCLWMDLLFRPARFVQRLERGIRKD